MLEILSKKTRVFIVDDTEINITMLAGTIVGKQGRTYPRRSGLCLETQHFPDSPNQSTFPSTVIRPGSPFMSSTLFIFSGEH